MSTPLSNNRAECGHKLETAYCIVKNEIPLSIRIKEKVIGALIEVHAASGTFSYTQLTQSTGDPGRTGRRKLHRGPEEFDAVAMTKH